MTILLICVAACVCGVLASVVMTWASDRSAVFGMVIGGALAFAVLTAALLIALLLTRAAYPR